MKVDEINIASLIAHETWAVGYPNRKLAELTCRSAMDIHNPIHVYS
jgi:hypothetical protein